MTDSTSVEPSGVQEVYNFTSENARTLLSQGWHAYCTQGNQVYEYTFTPREQVAHHLKEQMMTASSKLIGLLRPPAIEAPVRVAAASRRTVGPFDRLLMSERPLTANEVRKMFKLTARHGRNPR